MLAESGKNANKNTAIAGPEYFGLNDPNVIQAMEALPNAENVLNIGLGRKSYWHREDYLMQVKIMEGKNVRRVIR